MSTLNELQTRQAELLAQQAEMNRALLDISGKLGLVEEMSKALWALLDISGKLGLVEEMSKALCGVTMPAHATSDGAGETREAQHAIRGVCEEDIGFCEVMQLRAFRTTSKTFLWTAVLQD
eukprot:g19449.t1